MDRKKFLKSVGMTGMVSTMGLKWLAFKDGLLASRNTSPSDCGPKIDSPLYQGPFSFNLFPDWEVVMVTTPSDRILNNVGMGLVTYVIDEVGPPKIIGETLAQSVEKLVQIPFGQKLYMRLNWKDLQRRPGELTPSKAWEITFDMAEKYNKRIGFRVMISNPNIPGSALPHFVAEKVLRVKLGRTEKLGRKGSGKIQSVPRYASSEFQKYFREFDNLLASKYNKDPRVEYMDTYMYGFWGEGHTWPFERKGNPFRDPVVTEKTFLDMFQYQCHNWDNVPLVTNTQPDVNNAGNSALLRDTLRTNNWLRSDTIFIANQQIDELSNRPSWIGAALEVGMSDGTVKNIHEYNGQTHTANEIHHVMDIGSNYYSLWNWHDISAEGILRYYEKYPNAIDKIAQKIGYRIRPSFVWHIEKDGHDGLIFGFVNDGISSVPGVIKLTLKTEQGKLVRNGYLDPGYPNPSGVRQALMMLPKGVNWKGLRLYAEIKVKEHLYPVQWASREKSNVDGSLTLKPTPYVSS